MAVAYGGEADGVEVCGRVSADDPDHPRGWAHACIQMLGRQPSNSFIRLRVAWLTAGPVHWAEPVTARAASKMDLRENMVFDVSVGGR